jgi:hypothetical protein
MVIVGLVLRAMFALVAIDAPVWLLPTALLGWILYRRAGR